ncbi:cry2-2 [Populus alba x Populus x berolinensis]|nr:cry2-2 [Populus alba x Populus x berolinensis]
MSSIKTIVWFRRDLRIEDNRAFAASARDGCVFPVFIWCPKEGQFYPGRVSSIETIVATTVAFNNLYVPVSLVRDHNIKEKLVEIGIFVQSYNGDLLYEPWEIYDERGYAFTTFEAFRDKCSHMQMEPVSHLPPWRLVPAAGTIVMCSVEELGLEMKLKNLVIPC